MDGCTCGGGGCGIWAKDNERVHRERNILLCKRFQGCFPIKSCTLCKQQRQNVHGKKKMDMKSIKSYCIEAIKKFVCIENEQ